MKLYKQEYTRRITDEQAVASDFNEQKIDAIDGMSKLLLNKKELKNYSPDVENEKVEPMTNPVGNYRFVSKVEIETIDNEYISQLIGGVLNKGREIKISDITEEDLRDMIKRYPSDDELRPLDALKMKINQKLDLDFKVKNTIIENGMDVYDELSSGFDAQIYFSLLSGETREKGIYIIDQPEDHISQKAIQERVLDEFRNMGRNRQVIMVTHNPQFIVNLDVDNVIFLSKDKSGFKIESGALEYNDEKYSILQIVADNIDGGLTTIQGRLKRYEKNISF